MPKETFFNLPEDKRQRIIDVAIAEFSANDYRSASISRLVADAQIAKGSFYQYFDDKKDLYLYLLDLAAQKKMDFFTQNPPPSMDMSVFDYMRWLFRVGVKFEFDHPGLNKIAYQAIYGDKPALKETIDQIQARTLQFYKALLEKGVDQGDIRPGIDLDTAAFIFATVSVNLGDYIMRRLEIPPDTLLTQGTKALDQKTVENIYNSVMDLLEQGMGTSL